MKKLNIGITLLASLFWFSCSDEEVTEPAVIPEQPEEVAGLLQQYNTNVAALQLMAEGDVNIVDYTEDGESGYKLTLDNNWIVGASSSAEVDNDIPVMGINEAGYWVYQLNGTQVELTDVSGNAVPALRKTGKGVFTPQIALGEDGCWKMSLNGVQWKNLSTDVTPSLEAKTAASYSLFKSASVTDGVLSLQTAVGELSLNMDASASTSSEAWKKFMMKAEDNVLLDFSYAGYMHGEVAPPDVRIDFDTPLTDASGNKYYNGYIAGGAQGSAVYKVYNIEDYGANGNDEVSDRPALIKILKEVMKCTEQSADKGKTFRYYIGGNNANAIIYFPVGKYILRGGNDAETVETLRLTMGNIIFKGAGQGKTTIEMAVKNNATDPKKMWSTPNMLEFKHNSDLTELTTVTGNAEKGTFSIEVASTSGINVGDWICVSLKNNDPALVAEELAPHATSSNWTELNDNGVQIYDYHQVKQISGNTLTFYEPIMRKIEAKWGWKVNQYPHYENVGVEDLTFLGHSKDDFKHHGSADDDGAFKPIQMIRLTNSWMRRVNFESVSEAHSFVSCANVSAYDIEISGNRGHSAIRSQASSRVFIGKVYDHCNGYIAVNSGGNQLGDYMEGAGQYHGCGVSKQSMGAVIWNVRWGDDSCFESHATQPRATLIDICQGGFVAWREGGDMAQLPNHLNDLTIWNMTATRVVCDASWNNKWIWWNDAYDGWWKNMPPIIVGWNGISVPFDTSENQIKYYESLDAPVSPNSLYEAQLKRRLGYVPGWLSALK
ncbi:DUF4955 domain-containing protein [Phocaeicola plebeius]|uniref:DUF4955 domain-containing protein n=1 Tax=Phocaeicola plebeius TaxID=310297 RepID=UPI0026F00611|nr:DUF4955 domain-containing protein [Phocaeicola plebeius]